MRRHWRDGQDTKLLPGELEAVALGAVQHAPAPTLGQTWQVGQNIRNTDCEHGLLLSAISPVPSVTAKLPSIERASVASPAMKRTLE